MFNGNEDLKDTTVLRNEKLELICVRNPFNRTDREVTSIAYDNQSLAGILQQYVPKDAEVNASINGKVIPKDIWQSIYPQVGEQIVVIPIVAGGDDDKAILSIVLMIAVAWAAPGIVGALGLPGAFTAAGELTFLGTLYAAGVMVAGGILISSLTPAPQMKQPGYDISQIYGWSPQTTQQQGLVVPKFYGKNKHFANIFAVHTDISGDGEKQILKFIAGLGVGPIESVSNKRLNDQPIGNYTDVSSEDRLGLIDQAVTTIFGSTKPQYRPNIKVTVSGGAKTYIIPDNDYDDIEIDIFFSRGIYWANDQGGLSDHSIGIRVEISEYDAESWTTIGEETITRNSTNRFWKTYLASDSMVITNGTKYKVKVTKTTSDKESARYGDDVYISSIHEIFNDDFQYPKTAYVAISALATDQLANTLRFSCETEDAIVDTYNGTSWTLQWSDNPAWVLYDILTQPVISGDGNGTSYAVERYDGINPSRIDYAKFYELAVFCDVMVPDGKESTEKRITFNGGFDVPTTMWEAALKVCEIARSALVWNGINLTLAIDKFGDAVQMFSVGNIVKDTFKETFLQEKDRASEIELRYVDADLGYKLTPFTIFNTAVNNPTNKVTLELFGVNKQSEAWRAGMYRLAQNEYLKTVVDFEADIDAIACTLGDIIYVQHDIPQWGKGGRVSSATNNTVTVHRKLSSTSGVDQIMVRNPDDDTMETKTVTGISNSGNWSTLTISGTWTKNPIRDDLFAYGVQNLITKKFRIIDLRRSSDQQCAIKALQNDPEVYTPDGAEPILPALQVTPSESDAIIRPPNWEEMINRMPQNVIQGISVDIPLITNLTWTDNSPDSGKVAWSATIGANPILLTYKGTTYEITAGNTANKYIYWDPSASTVFSTSANGGDMVGANIWPMCINDDGTASRVTSIPVLHGGIIRAGTIIAGHLYVLGLDSDGKLDLGQIGDNYLAKENLAAKSPANLLDNPDFELGDQNWTKQEGWSIVEDASEAYVGDWVAKFEWISGSVNKILLQNIKVSEGEIFHISGYFKSGTGTDRDVGLWVNFYDKDGGIVSGSYGEVSVDTTYTQITKTLTVPATAVIMRIICAIVGVESGAICYVDMLIVHQLHTADEVPDGSTYSTMLKAWRHSTDPTKMDLSLGFAASITTAQIGLLAVHTAQINDLSVDTLQIANQAVTVPSSAYTEGTTGTGAVTIQTLTIEPSGNPLFILISFSVYAAERQWTRYANIVVERGVGETPGSWDTIWGVVTIQFMTLYSQTILQSISITDNPGTGTFTYRIRTTTSTCSFTNRSMLILETKK